MSVNRVLITGNLTRDPELRHYQTQEGQGSILSFGVAVNDRRRNAATGEWEDYANFVDCTMFGNRAEKLAGMLRKGTKVTIEGRLHYSTWEKDGARRSKLDVTVDNLEFMSPRQTINPEQVPQQVPQQQVPQQAPQASYGYPQQAPAAQAPQASYGGYQQPVADVYSDDIPF